MKYLGIEAYKPRIAVFDFTCCEGCELQLTNKEETLVPFLAALEVVEFREASSARGDDYEIALIEGAISRGDEVERLKAVRAKAKTVVAFGTCACFGGVNKMKNSYDLDEANREVYGSLKKETLNVFPVREIVPVDLSIPGCPVNKAEVERIVQHIVWDVPFAFPVYPVCVECKQRYTICMFDKGGLCLGPITRAGCDAPCPAGGLGCFGCRGPADDPNYKEFLTIAKEKGFSETCVRDHLDFFGGFEDVL
jgi:coenzyme F420-reducing hydrogenase gamma subunit